MSTEIKVTYEERARRAARAVRNRNTGMSHPATSEIDYTEEELEFFGAMQTFKHKTGRQFPTLRETLGVLRGLGYTSRRWHLD